MLQTIDLARQAILIPLEPEAFGWRETAIVAHPMFLSSQRGFLPLDPRGLERCERPAADSPGNPVLLILRTLANPSRKRGQA